MLLTFAKECRVLRFLNEHDLHISDPSDGCDCSSATERCISFQLSLKLIILHSQQYNGTTTQNKLTVVQCSVLDDRQTFSLLSNSNPKSQFERYIQGLRIVPVNVRTVVTKWAFQTTVLVQSYFNQQTPGRRGLLYIQFSYIVSWLL